MTTYRTYGKDAASYVIDGNGTPSASTICKVYDAVTGGTQITDLKSYDGTTSQTTVTTDAYGGLAFQAPDTYSSVWIDAGGGERAQVFPTDVSSRLVTAEGNITTVTATANAAMPTTTANSTFAAPAIRQDAQRLTQQAPSGGVRIDPNTLAANNAAAYLTTPSYDGSGQMVEPCVLYFPLGWNGYKYWAVMSPYPNGVGTYENPSILASTDGTTWVVPAGLTNPIDSGGSYNDGSLFMQDNTMWCIYGTSALYAKSSTDGVTWSARQTISGTIAGGVGPTVVRRGNTYYLWITDTSTSPNTLRCYTASSPTGTYTALGACTVTGLPSGRDLWESNIVLINDQFVSAQTVCDLDTTGANADLYIMTSTDGLSWTMGNAPLLYISAAGSWDAGGIYRSTLVPLDGRGGQLFDLFYSAFSATNVFHIGRTTVTYSPPRALSAWRMSPQLLNYHYPPVLSTMTRTGPALPLNQFIAGLCYCDEDIWVNQLAVNVQAGAATALERLGIYIPRHPQNPFEFPGDTFPVVNLLVDAGTVDCSTTGIKTASFAAVKVPAGWFFVGSVAQTAAATLYLAGSSSGTAYFSPLGLNQAGMLATPQIGYASNATVTGALPAVLPFAGPNTSDGGVTYQRSA